MFCYQCEQTAKGEGCTKVGVCGKLPEVADLQDMLIYALEGLSLVAAEAGSRDIGDGDVDVFTCKALFSTLTNVNFDPKCFVEAMIEQAVMLSGRAQGEGSAAGGKARFFPDRTGLQAGGHPGRAARPGGNGGAEGRPGGKPGHPVAQAHAALRHQGGRRLCRPRPDPGPGRHAVYTFVQEALAALAHERTSASMTALGLVLKCGEVNLRAMELLDAANTGTYGHPVPTQVPSAHKRGKAILVSGHDLKDLEELLKQTEGKGINIYTHGEMLPTHGYPGLKKYPHFYGHYGTAWQNQAKGVRRVSRRDPHDHQLHPATRTRPTRTTSSPRASWAGRECATSTRPGFAPGDRKGTGDARLHRRYRRQERSWWALRATPSWALPER